MSFEDISAEVILFFILYGITAAVPLMAALYLLLRRSNAFAPDVTPPLRLRRWAAAFFAVSALGHVWWYLFLIYSGDIHSASYVVVAVIDCFGMLTTIAGTLLAMLQDRKRPVWPVVVALLPYVMIVAYYLVCSDEQYLSRAIAYILLLYVIFTVYLVFAVRQYRRWLRDNYADLERKEVWRSQVVLSVFMLLFILYTLVDTDGNQIFLLHFVELLLFSLLLWRVETLPLLEVKNIPEQTDTSSEPEASDISSLMSHPSPQISNIDPDNIEQLLNERCVGTQLYLRHGLTLQQLAQAIGTNRCYLGQYFSSHGTTYNAYINDLRINHFMNLYREAVAAGHSVTAQQLAYDSGYRSYSTFSLAFKQRMGESVTAWMRKNAR